MHGVDKTQSAYQLATKVRQKWSRIIFKKSASYNKTADQMDEEEEDGGPKHLPKANREWEKMPESIKANGENTGADTREKPESCPPWPL